jgi:hypothetical protein
MSSGSVTVRIDRRSDSTAVPAVAVPSGEDVAATIRELAGETDVTVTISQRPAAGKLMVAINGDEAFVGLDDRDGLFQFVAADGTEGEVKPFCIGGQWADIESRYLLDVEMAADVAQEWLARGRESSSGAWERQLPGLSMTSVDSTASSPRAGERILMARRR